MKNRFIRCFFIFTIFFFALNIFASEREANRGKEISFEDLLVKGKYHFSDEAVITVEQDKILDALLGIRKDFRDRMKQSAKKH